ncbi:HNH endonuclease family protein [Cereibacter sphaeroides]|uniref:GmrSD restriction endonuclease domain-containing protein n=1 Tax=Cereibacter sphaeroides TaxID=1063 RepID=UPI001F352E7B|nr:DUF1524 domain-containing protein [Cereibacter sphaeroides]MCE6958254.1 HNH endonuclease family protein [Cereibacter sphaeroides]MCE6971193.1 HNH endonuclease family protein [Cereibacter sphaeroides]
MSGPVKLSRSGICHDASSPYYEKTTRFTAFPDLASCLAVGRLPKGAGAAHEAAPAEAAAPAPHPPTWSVSQASSTTRYDRDLYGGWTDADGDCRNTRAEVLESLATGPVSWSANGCSVKHGRWNDPYTGRIFTEAHDLDIDHMVPLAWAHAHGAAAWSTAARAAFANDPVNLFAVEASVNREKGASGPLEWLPPNAAYRCEYVTRFHRIVLMKGLVYAPGEREAMDRLRTEVCG